MSALLVEAGLSAAHGVFGRSPPKHVAEPRDHPCLRACREVSLKLSKEFEVGLALGLGLGWG